jgi:hypothetical protein
MPQLISEMNVHCVGRYLIELPREVDVEGGLSVSSVDIRSTKMDLRQFNANLLLRGSKLKLTKSYDEHPFFYKEGVGKSEHTRYFISRRREGGDPGARRIEAYKWDHGYEIKLEITGSDYTDPDQTADSLVKMMTDINDVPRKKEVVLDLLSRVRGRSDEDIPSEPGVCFSGGFIAGRAGETEEVWSSYAILPNPDVFFTIRTFTDIKEDDTLLQRGASNQKLLASIGAKLIRKGVVDLPDLPAEEWLMRSKTIKGVPGQSFTLEANQSSGRPQAPLVTLELQTGVTGNNHENPPKNSSLSDDEALKVWDAVSRSLRARPNGF